MMRIALAIASIVVVADWGVVVVDASCATATPKQFTWSCGGICDEYIPCLVFNASDCADCSVDVDEECAYKCFTNFYFSDEQAALLIPYGSSYQSEEEIDDREALGDAAYDAQFDAFSNDTEIYSWATNDDLDSIAAVEIKPNISTL
jgi:hypothetical protein